MDLVEPLRAQFRSRRPIESAREIAEAGLPACRDYLADPANARIIETALRIRAVESALYDLFGKGKLHGTIHTCLGQEFSGAVLSKHLRRGDFITSNHRCHGHYIGATGDWRGLIDELIGNAEGVCAGIGSSQHLCADNFLSNGQQGGLLPVAAGIALDRKLKAGGGVAVSFIGEGTLGEGIVYETMNLDALWTLPHIIVCENNFYSQSTGQERGVAGAIMDRAAAFGIPVAAANTWDLAELDAVFAAAVERARLAGTPTFILLTTYRLNPHSKGDDTRDPEEIAWFRARDPASLATAEIAAYARTYDAYVAEAAAYIDIALATPKLEPSAYFGDQLPRVDADRPAVWRDVPAVADETLRIAQQLNKFYRNWLARDESSLFLGEDIEDPYGGAFKISKGFTTEFAERAITTPISEAAITGIGVGLAVSGRRAFVEIMFGDFITYAFDQIVNNASKMFHMYNRQIECPVIVRTPMGARRGYGPTHSQSFERFLIGIDNVCTISLNSMTDVETQLRGLQDLRCPVILLENKSDYTARTFVPPAHFVVATDDAPLPTIRVAPKGAKPTVTVLSYGGMARFVAASLLDVFERTDQIPELIVPTSLHPLNLGPIAESVLRTGALLVVEEGAGFGSFGAEAIAQLHAHAGSGFVAARLSAKPAPIPSAPGLEAAALPSIDEVCDAIRALAERTK